MSSTPNTTNSRQLNPHDFVPDLRAVIAITGAASRAGKTTAMEALIPILRHRGHRVTALKVTRTHIGDCPRMHPTCTTCNDLAAPFQLITDEKRIQMPGKDTGRYSAAGAEQVLWLQAQPADLTAGLRHALSHVHAGHVLLGEGNSFREHAWADLTLMALGKNIQLKKSAQRIVDKTTAWACIPDGLKSAKKWLKETKRDKNMAFSTENWQWLDSFLSKSGL